MIAIQAGCAGNRDDRSRYVRNGVEYGTTDGAFRGRWWNYYERGRSYLDGGFYEDAEADFLIAIRSRGTDQLWARTYGLRFLPEYFGHRELGITYYHQGRYEEAIEELQTSYGQQRSARAGYFIDETREILYDAIDAQPPTIEVLEPTTASWGNYSVELFGVARDDSFVRRIAIDGQSIPLDVSGSEVRFSRSLDLGVGINEVRILAEDVTGKITEIVHRINIDVAGPAVAFDAPLQLPGRISGLAYDTSGVARVVIGGRDLPLTSGSNGQVLFNETFALDGLEPPLRYSAVDALGNETQGVVHIQRVSGISRSDEIVFASTAQSKMHFPAGVTAIRSGGRVVAYEMAQQLLGRDAPDIQFRNLEDGQQFMRDEIVVALSVDSDVPLREMRFNGVPMDVIPDVPRQHLSRRIRLELGHNTLIVEAADTHGRSSSAQVVVEHVPVGVERALDTLGMAVLGYVWDSALPQSEGEVSYLTVALSKELELLQRFRLVNRSLLPEILSEQQLSAALSSNDGKIALGKIVPAETMVIGWVRQYGDATMEIIVQVIGTETTRVLSHIDVAGPASQDDPATRRIQVERLIGELALKLVQEFPRVEGRVRALRDADTFISTLSRAQRVRDSMKYIVFREVEREDFDGTTFVDLEELGEAIVRAVTNDRSVADLLVVPPDDAPIEAGDRVVTK